MRLPTCCPICVRSAHCPLPTAHISQTLPYRNLPHTETRYRRQKTGDRRQETATTANPPTNILLRSSLCARPLPHSSPPPPPPLAPLTYFHSLLSFVGPHPPCCAPSSLRPSRPPHSLHSPLRSSPPLAPALPSGRSTTRTPTTTPWRATTTIWGSARAACPRGGAPGTPQI